MAALAEPRTPKLHRSEPIAPSRVRMEAWRQWQTRQEKNPCPRRKNLLDSDRPSHGRPLHSKPPSSLQKSSPVRRWCGYKGFAALGTLYVLGVNVAALLWRN